MGFSGQEPLLEITAAFDHLGRPCLHPLSESDHIGGLALRRLPCSRSGLSPISVTRLFCIITSSPSLPPPATPLSLTTFNLSLLS